MKGGNESHYLSMFTAGILAAPIILQKMQRSCAVVRVYKDSSDFLVSQ